MKAKGEYSARCQVKAGVPQGSLLGVLLFNVYLNVFDSVQVDLYNFADDNNLSIVSNTIDEAKAILITETEAAINWIESNQMIANSEKFHLMFLSANEKNLINQQTINMKGISLKSEANFMLRGIDIDNHLSFHGHINNLCGKAASQINALERLSSFMGMTEKMILMKSFILSNFNYCPLVWHFCSRRDMDKMKKIQKRALRMVLDDCESGYETLLQSKAKMQFLHVSGINPLAIKIYNTLHSLNPSYISEIFKEKSTGRCRLRSKYKLTVQRYNTVTFGRNSLRILGPKIWNHLPREFITAEDLKTFKILMKQWNGPQCNCNLCKYPNQMHS